MARLPRLSMPGIAHYVLQRGHNGSVIVHDAQDADRLLQILREAALSSAVVLHAYAIGERELRLLATPEGATDIGRMMQALGRRYAAIFNRRHGRSGALWDGRFRSALIEPGVPTLQALRQIDGLPTLMDAPAAGTHDPGAEPPMAAAGATASALVRNSRAHRTGGRRDASLIDPPEYWQLGNTPFDRESRYRALLTEPLGSIAEAHLQRALQGAWAWGSSTFLAALATASNRPLAPRARGRPRRTP